MKTLMQKLMTTAAVIGLTAAPAFAEMTSDTEATVSDDSVTMQSETSVETDGMVDTAEQTGDELMMKTEETANDVADATSETWEDTKDTASDMADATADAATDVWEGVKSATASAADAIETFGDEIVSDIIGTNVLAESGEDVGEIDAIVETDGTLQAVVGVGGFLGIAEHDVLIEMDKFSMVDESTVMINGVTAAEIEAMPEVDQSELVMVDGELTLEQAINS